MDTSDPSAPSAPVPDEPGARPPEPPAVSPPPAGPPPTPTAPIALGPAGGGWMPPPPPPPPAPPMTPGTGGGAWGPISTPYGLAWGPHPIPPVSVAQRRPHRFMALTAVVVTLSVLAGVAVGYGVWRPTPTTSNAAANGGNSGSGSFIPSFGNGSSGSGSLGNGSTGSGPSSSAASAVAAKVDPGLVDINVTLSYQQESAAGTGQVLTSSGEVLTNNHVVDEATSISATDIGNGRTYSASVVGYDRTGDLAIIQLHGASGLSTVTIGDSSKVAVGQSIVAIGNAGGVGGTPSVAPGTVTTLNQSITASDDGGGNAEQLTGLIEVNANVQPGDSGGPLVTTAGDVVGIDTAAAQSLSGFSAQGDGYAIPINTAIAIARQIEAGKSSSTVHVGATAFLGVEVESPENGGSGAQVVSVAAGSPASSTALAQGDVITSVGGQTVGTVTSLSTIIATHSPGDSVVVQWTDLEGNQQSATVKLASGPAT
jgi:S1-C subfamily serine protease